MEKGIELDQWTIETAREIHVILKPYSPKPKRDDPEVLRIAERISFNQWAYEMSKPLIDHKLAGHPDAVSPGIIAVSEGIVRLANQVNQGFKQGLRVDGILKESIDLHTAALDKLHSRVEALEQKPSVWRFLRRLYSAIDKRVSNFYANH